MYKMHVSLCFLLYCATCFDWWTLALNWGLWVIKICKNCDHEAFHLGPQPFNTVCSHWDRLSTFPWFFPVSTCNSQFTASIETNTFFLMFAILKCLTHTYTHTHTHTYIYIYRYTVMYRSSTKKHCCVYYCTRATCFDSYRIVFRPF